MLFLIDAVLLGLGGIGAGYVLVAGGRACRRAERAAKAALTEAGLDATGDLLGRFVARPLQGKGTDVVIRSCTRHVHSGVVAPVEEVCLASLEVQLADQIVCRAADADAVMGPLPAVPRQHTGHVPFDDAYAVFVGVSGGPAAPGGPYRGAPVTSDIPWARPALIDRLMELDLRWMRVCGGRAEIAFPPLSVVDLGRAAALALAVEKAARGGAAPALVRGPRAKRSSGPVNPVEWLKMLVGVSLAAGLGGGMVLFWVCVALGIDQELACGPGDAIDVANQLYCSHRLDSHFDVYFFACGLMAAGLWALVWVGYAAKSLWDGDSPPELMDGGS